VAPQNLSTEERLEAALKVSEILSSLLDMEAPEDQDSHAALLEHMDDYITDLEIMVEREADTTKRLEAFDLETVRFLGPLLPPAEEEEFDLEAVAA